MGSDQKHDDTFDDEDFEDEDFDDEDFFEDDEFDDEYDEDFDDEDFDEDDDLPPQISGGTPENKPLYEEASSSVKEEEKEESVLEEEAAVEEKEPSPPTPPPPQALSLTAAEELSLPIHVEVGRLQLSLADLLQLQPGKVLELGLSNEQAIHLVVNGRPVAKGELVQVGDVLGVRVLEVG